MSFEDDQWEVGKVIARDVMGTSRNKVLEQLWAWYLRRPGAQLPERPPAEEIERAFAAWQERQAVEEVQVRRQAGESGAERRR